MPEDEGLWIEAHTKEKTVSLDGVEFTMYVQRFSDGEAYVGAYAVDLHNRKKYVIWPADPLVAKDNTFETDTTGEG